MTKKITNTKTSNEKAISKIQKKSVIQVADDAIMMDNDFETENVSETHDEDQDDEHLINDFRSDSDENEFIDRSLFSQNTHEDFEHFKKHSKSYDIESNTTF